MNYVADAMLQAAKDLTVRLGARRVAIDSLSSLNLSIGAEGRSQQLVYVLVKTFRAMGVTAILTNETPQLLGTSEPSGHGLSAFADNIIMLRYAEIESRLARAISVLKVRGSGHEDSLRELIIARERLEVGEPFLEYRGVLTGVPTVHDTGPGARRKRRARAAETQTGESQSGNK